MIPQAIKSEKDNYYVFANENVCGKFYFFIRNSSKKVIYKSEKLLIGKNNAIREGKRFLMSQIKINAL